MTEPNLNPPDDNFEQRADTEVYFETLEAELETMAGELDAANSEIAQRDTVIDEMRVELGAVRAQAQPTSMTFGQPFDVLNVMLPEQHIAVAVERDRYSANAGGSSKWRWKIYVGGEPHYGWFEAPTAEAALGEVMIAQLQSSGEAAQIDAVVGDMSIALEDAPTIPPPAPIDLDDICF